MSRANVLTKEFLVLQLLTENPGLSRGGRLASGVTPLHVAAGKAPQLQRETY